MSKQILAFAAVVAAAFFIISNIQTPHSFDSEFESFKMTHSKSYANEAEESYRKSIFLMNLAQIKAHNADQTQTHKLGVTQFSDLTQQQFVSIHLTLKVNKKFTEENVNARSAAGTVGDVDWTANGKVHAVKNQGGCGSCWAFSATAALESAYLIAGQDLDLSEQQLVDCSRAYGNQGCSGGWMDSAFQYIIDHGITLTSSYPYKAVNQNCAIDGGSVKMSSFVDVPGCSNLETALTGRPISVAVDASVWSQYRTGILSSCGGNVNHGVLLVGSNSQYWKIKNSWGGSWGESGYIRLAKGNTCAICSYPSYPQI